MESKPPPQKVSALAPGFQSTNQNSHFVGFVLEKKNEIIVQVTNTTVWRDAAIINVMPGGKHKRHKRLSWTI